MKKLLFISHRLPYPPDKGERLRSFHQLRLLAERFDITLATTLGDDDTDFAKLREYCDRIITVRRGGLKSSLTAGLYLLGGRSASEGYFAAGQLARRLRQSGQNYDVAVGYCSSMLKPLLAARARRRIMDLVDVDSEKWLSCAALSSFPKSLLHKTEAARVKKLEARALKSCDGVTVTAPRELELLKKHFGPSENAHVISNGVDCDFFSYSPPAENPVAVFTATMDYQPNIDAAVWMASEIWPRVLKRHSNARFIIVGRSPTAAVRTLASGQGVEVTGAVDDVRDYLRQAAVAVAPLRVARGVQNKVLEAMAAGPAVVATPAALDGLPLGDSSCVLSAQSSEDFSDCVCRLFDDSQLARSQSQLARKSVCENFSWQATLTEFLNLCDDQGD